MGWGWGSGSDNCPGACAVRCAAIPEKKLDELRRTVGVVQHHDAATGTERQAVADDYSRRMNRALQEGAEALNISASFVPPFLNKSKAGFARFIKGNLSYPGVKSIFPR